MNAFLIDAVVSANERPAVAAAAEQLRNCLSAASGGVWSVETRIRESLAAIDPQDRPTAIVASLLPELDGDEPIAAVESRWREQLALLPAEARSSVLLCTIFHHVAASPPDAQPDARPAIRERILRLNMMAVELSHDTGAGVADIDRAFSQQGARLLRTDCRLHGSVAAAAAAHTIVAGILRGVPDDALSPELQERAQQLHGELRDLVAPDIPDG